MSEHDADAPDHDSDEARADEEHADDVHAPVPHPDDDLLHLTVFADEDTTGADDAVVARSGAGAAAYDDETDLAVPVHEPDPGNAFTPFGASLPAPQPGYDVDRDTGI